MCGGELGARGKYNIDGFLVSGGTVSVSVVISGQ